MILDEFEVMQGTPLRFRVTLEDDGGVIINSGYPGGGYTGTETFACKVWPGGTLPTTFTAATPPAWLDHLAGTVAVAISAAETALLVPGRHKLLMLLIDGAADPADAYECVIVVKAGPGGVR